MKICILSFSEGKNLELSKRIELKFKELGAQVHLIDVVSLGLPLYSTTAEKSYEASQLVYSFKEKLNADALVFIAPEYNGGPPPSFNNFMAWVSRSTKEWRETFNNKPALIGTHSAGGGLSLLSILRLQLAYVGMNVLGRQIHTTLQKSLEEKSLNEICDLLIQQIKK